MPDVEPLHSPLAPQSLRGDDELSKKERRRAARHGFRTIQRIALWRTLDFPAESDFFDVQCHDISQSGFSFLLPIKPDFVEVVAELRMREAVIYLRAKVAHAREVLIDEAGRLKPIRNEIGLGLWFGQEDGGRPMFLVGCRFLRRLHKPRHGGGELERM